jgi:hypothetical protein
MTMTVRAPKARFQDMEERLIVATAAEEMLLG